jgi:hypothetical protein
METEHRSFLAAPAFDFRRILMDFAAPDLLPRLRPNSPL